jgi:hypothetical protein
MPLPEGRGYREGMPGLTVHQVGISLKEEVPNHKGNSDENNAAPVKLPPPAPPEGQKRNPVYFLLTAMERTVFSCTLRGRVIDSTPFL